MKLGLTLDAGLDARALLALVLLLDPLGSLPAPEDRAAETGLSADIDPGGIAWLADNDAPLLRR